MRALPVDAWRFTDQGAYAGLDDFRALFPAKLKLRFELVKAAQQKVKLVRANPLMKFELGSDHPHQFILQFFHLCRRQVRLPQFVGDLEGFVCIRQILKGHVEKLGVGFLQLFESFEIWRGLVDERDKLFRIRSPQNLGLVVRLRLCFVEEVHDLIDLCRCELWGRRARRRLFHRWFQSRGRRGRSRPRGE